MNFKLNVYKIESENRTIKRPIILMIFCLFGILGILSNVIFYLYPSDFSDETPLFMWVVVSQLLSVITIYGIWNLKGWALLLFFMNNLINQNVLYFYKQWHPSIFWGFLIWSIVLYTQREKMIFKNPLINKHSYE